MDTEVTLWKWKIIKGMTAYSFIVPNNGQDIGYIAAFDPTVVGYVNANKMVTAPEMLEELERLRDVVCEEDVESIDRIVARARGK